MAAVPVFIGDVDESAKLTLKAPSEFKRYIRGLIGRTVEVVVRRPRSIRSLNQNAYYWGVVIATLAEEFGYDPPDMHEALKGHFLKREEPGKPLPIIQSTASLGTQDMGCDRARHPSAASQ
jgi:hypothetical protein